MIIRKYNNFLNVIILRFGQDNLLCWVSPWSFLPPPECQTHLHLRRAQILNGSLWTCNASTLGRYHFNFIKCYRMNHESHIYECLWRSCTDLSLRCDLLLRTGAVPESLPPLHLTRWQKASISKWACYESSFHRFYNKTCKSPKK